MELAFEPQMKDDYQGRRYDFWQKIYALNVCK